jgi:small subunit ribosomal protein S6
VTKYETVYIVEPNYDDAKAQEFADKVSGWIRDLGGEIVEVQKWGKRRLAYEIRKRRDGVYTMLVWNGQGPSVKELERRMQLNENVMRVLTTLYVSPELSKGVPEGEAVPAGAATEEGDE